MALNARTLIFLPAGLLLAVAGCGREEVNPPTEPAAPVTPPGDVATPGRPTPDGGVGPAMPSAGPASFVGDWAARRGWCANTTGPEQPIRITTTRFEGYENVCMIGAIDQVNSGYEAAMTCQGEGETSRERVRMAVLGNEMTLTWLSRDGAQVKLVRCVAPGETAEPATPPS